MGVGDPGRQTVFREPNHDLITCIDIDSLPHDGTVAAAGHDGVSARESGLGAERMKGLQGLVQPMRCLGEPLPHRGMQSLLEATAV